jgi:hypothetical protein
MDIRAPGAAPFHLRATFHSYPGEEFLGLKQKPQVIAGDGVYDEIWMEPHRWRREVTFGSYHAVEVFGNGVRKFQATDDYEPSRVYMLLGKMLDPVGRGLFSKEFRSNSDDRIVSKVAVGDTPLVRVHYPDTQVRGATFRADDYFLPRGLLFMSSGWGLQVERRNYFTFGGKVVPGTISFTAGTRNLLLASITIERAEPAVDTGFDLPTERAEAGAALNPHCDREFRGNLPSGSWTNPGGATATDGLVFHLMVGRDGRIREAELITGLSLQNAEPFINLLRKAKPLEPATIDGSPCEVSMFVPVQ